MIISSELQTVHGGLGNVNNDKVADAMFDALMRIKIKVDKLEKELAICKAKLNCSDILKQYDKDIVEGVVK